MLRRTTQQHPQKETLPAPTPLRATPSYGYHVVDLGKDVPAESVVEAVEKHHAKLVGLTALMTTTVAAMEDTIQALRRKTHTKILVGGAVMTQEYADTIGADGYAPDAVAAVDYANQLFKGKGE